MRARLSVLMLVVGALVLAACGTEEQAGEVTSSDGGTGDSSVTDADADGDGGQGSEGEETDGDADGDDGTTTETTAAQGDVELAGDPFDIGPPEGDRLDVVGVAYDDTLNFRERPDVGSPVVDTAAPRSTSPAIVSQGEGRLLTRSAWWHVTVGGEDAWANFSFLGMLGGTTDVFDELSSQLGVVEEESLDDLVEAIATVRGSDGPEPTVTFATDPNADSGVVVVDIIGYGDDALKGERFLLSITNANADGTGVRLVGAEATLICGRGVSGTACV